MITKTLQKNARNKVRSLLEVTGFGPKTVQFWHFCGALHLSTTFLVDSHLILRCDVTQRSAKQKRLPLPFYVEAISWLFSDQIGQSLFYAGLMIAINFLLCEINGRIFGVTLTFDLLLVSISPRPAISMAVRRVANRPSEANFAGMSSATSGKITSVTK